MELRHVATASRIAAGAMTSPPGDFVVHATGAAPDPEARAHTEEAIAAVTRAAQPASTGFQAAAFRDGQTDATRSYDPGTAARLRELTARCDPDGIITRPRQLYQA
jgi:hypothetical protein